MLRKKCKAITLRNLFTSTSSIDWKVAYSYTLQTPPQSYNITKVFKRFYCSIKNCSLLALRLELGKSVDGHVLKYSVHLILIYY